MHRGKLWYYIALLTSGLYMMSVYMVRTLIPYTAASLGGEYIDVSRILYASFIVLALISPFSGWLCDRFGSWRILFLSAAMASILTLSYLLVHDIIQLTIIRVVHALVGSFVTASSLAIASWVTSHGGVGMGFLRLVQGLGIALGPIVAGLLSAYGYGYTFAIASLLAATPILAIKLGRTAARRGILPPWTAFRKASSIIWCRHIVALLPPAIGEVLIFAIILTYYTSYLVIYMGYTEIEYGLFLTLEAASFGIGSYISEYIYRSIGYLTAALGCLGLILGSLMLWNPLLKLAVFAAAIVIGLSSSLSLNPVYIEVSHRVSDDIRGIGINVLDMIINLWFLAIAPMEIFINIVGVNNIPLIMVLIILISSVMMLSIKFLRFKLGR